MTQSVLSLAGLRLEDFCAYPIISPKCCVTGEAARSVSPAMQILRELQLYPSFRTVSLNLVDEVLKQPIQPPSSL